MIRTGWAGSAMDLPFFSHQPLRDDSGIAKVFSAVFFRTHKGRGIEPPFYLTNR